MNVLVVGAGAIGALFGSVLARQGARVAVVCRSDYEAVERDGYDIRSGLLGDHRFRPDRVYRETSECAQPPDYLLLASKVLSHLDRAALIRPAIGPRTVIVLIQNGIDIEAPIAAAFPQNELLTGLAYIGVSRSGGGRIDHQTLGSLILGRYPDGGSAAAADVAAAFEAGKLPCKVTENVVSARWHKAVWNATFNPISILGGALDTADILRTAAEEAFVRRTMQEICEIARARGHPQPPNLIDQMIAGTKAMPPYRTSMALDLENGRPMEIEAILGNVVRAGREAGVAIPTLETIYALAKMVGREAAA